MLTAAPPMTLEVKRASQARGLRHWLQNHRGAVVMAGLLAFAGPLTFFTGALSVMRLPSAGNVARMGLWWMLYGVALWLALLAAGYVGERLARNFGRTIRGGIWLLAACSAAALANVVTAGRATILIEQGLVHSTRTMHLHGFTFSLIMALLYFAHLRRSREHEQAAARLAVAQTLQRDARRRIVRARLQEVQARIDPQLLFEMLATLRRLYERDVVRAERFLDELIDFLRAALPRLRTAWSSLSREVELSRSFVRLQALAAESAFDITLDLAPEALHARFPPGVLLPLLNAAAGSGTGPCRLSATRAGEGCRVVLALEAAPADAAVAHVRSLLIELYGTAGTLAIEKEAGAVNVIVEVPYELA
jgi:hypothetical protein